MDSKEFVDSIKEVVINNSIQSVLTNLIKPAGRAPAKKLLLLSEWYNNLNDTDKNIVKEVIKEAVEMSTFSLLCVLDGVSAIENDNKGLLKLYYEKGNTRILLNDPNKEYLHNLM